MEDDGRRIDSHRRGVADVDPDEPGRAQFWVQRSRLAGEFSLASRRSCRPHAASGAGVEAVRTHVFAATLRRRRSGRRSSTDVTPVSQPSLTFGPDTVSPRRSWPEPLWQRSWRSWRSSRSSCCSVRGVRRVRRVHSAVADGTREPRSRTSAPSANCRDLRGVHGVALELNRRHAVPGQLDSGVTRAVECTSKAMQATTIRAKAEPSDSFIADLLQVAVSFTPQLMPLPDGRRRRVLPFAVNVPDLLRCRMSS